MALRSLAWAIALVTASVLLLSAAGIYALMSFTVAQRTREIGIRTALGAPPQRVMLNVFGRAAWQVAAACWSARVLSAGCFAAIGLGRRARDATAAGGGRNHGLVALLATFGPARRALRMRRWGAR